jgi:hypothetical protein
MRAGRVVSSLIANLSRHCRVNDAVMDKYVQSVDQYNFASPDDAAFVAQSIQADFTDLVGIFDRQLDGLSNADDRIRSHITEARIAALRGLQLSGRLIEILEQRQLD